MNEAKRQRVETWLRKALHDLKAAESLGKSALPLPGAALHHCQQAAEQALRGFLVYFDANVEKRDDVSALLQQARLIEPVLATWQDAAGRLSLCAAMYRDSTLCDGPLREEFEEAYDDAGAIVRQMLTLLPGAVFPDAGTGA